MSSNEQTVSELIACPFCGQKDAFVEQLDSDASVVICQGRVDEYSACLARGPVGVQQSHDEVQPGYAAAVAAWNLQAEQHKGDPVGKLMRDKYQNIVIVPIGDPHITDGMLVYASADASEVTRLRCEVSKWRGTAGRVTHERDSLRAKLGELDALLRHLYDNNELSLGDDQLILSAISASAEPNAPKCWPCWCCQKSVSMKQRADADGNCPHCVAELDIEYWPFPPKPSEPIERDERADFEATIGYEPLRRRTKKGNYAYNDVENRWEGWQARAALERKP